MTDNILSKELCFQLYIASKEIIKKYNSYLNRYSLTYTGFIAMLAIENKMTINKLGEELSLDSGTLSPLLKRLEAKGYIIRKRSDKDERSVELFLTDKGAQVKKELPSISLEIGDNLVSCNENINYDLLLSQLLTLNKSLKTEI
ncbi:MarR family winged helix-turn-helix transcriptional regulator [Lactococcus sp. KTH0-1S]|uniref:MarR family winged helix-turn-helix transcriptional regulator n=1 Tax=Lactococcus sp. KTH0-1S TaxID=3438232 RepID=UPI00403CE8C5